jgi:hypothetical protein
MIESILRYSVCHQPSSKEMLNAPGAKEEDGIRKSEQKAFVAC